MLGTAPPVVPAVNETVRVCGDGVIDVIVGDPGVVAGMPSTVALASPAPRALTARTRTWYGTALVSPVIVNTPVTLTGLSVVHVNPSLVEY